MLDAAALITKRQGALEFRYTAQIHQTHQEEDQQVGIDEDAASLGDAAVAEACARDIVVLTADVQLQIALGSMGLGAINFNHVRPPGWS